MTERIADDLVARLPARIERRLLMLDQFQLKPFLSVAELADALGVSSMTVRRDLRLLAEDGVVRLEHGGALLIDGHALEGVFGQRERICTEEKAAIGRFAAGLVHDGEVIGLDAGTTTLAIARALRTAGQVTVVTHSLPAIMELANRSNVDIMALGGLLQAHTLAFAGPTVSATLRGLRLHTLFLAATGFTVEDGMTCVSLYETDTKRALIEAARRVVLVADHTKLGRIFLMHVTAMDNVHEVVTDAGLPDEARHALEERGLLVHVADAMPVGKGVGMAG